MMNIFQTGLYNLSSGQQSDFKIECDWLDANDWLTLAYLIQQRVRPFSQVEGVPRGGLQLAEALEPYTRRCLFCQDTGREWVPPATDDFGRAHPGNYYPCMHCVPLLIVDDVFTTGGSMERVRDGRVAQGAVVFARNQTTSWITTLFQMTPKCS